VPFLDRVLDVPSYGFLREGLLYVPTSREIWREFFARLNPFASRKNWLAVFTWSSNVALLVPLLLFVRFYFSWPLFALGLVYSMVALGTH